MPEVLSRCGYRCDLCLAWRPNVVANPSNPQTLSEGWQRYFGFQMPAEQIVCDGCRAENPRLIDTNCPVRPCVIERGLDHCGSCPDYVCQKLSERIVTYDEVVARIGREPSPEDRSRFIEPYENRARLDQLWGR